MLLRLNMHRGYPQSMLLHAISLNPQTIPAFANKVMYGASHQWRTKQMLLTQSGAVPLQKLLTLSNMRQLGPKWGIELTLQSLAVCSYLNLHWD